MSLADFIPIGIASALSSIFTFILTLTFKYWQIKTLSTIAIAEEVNKRIKTILQAYQERTEKLESELNQVKERYFQCCQENHLLKLQVEALKKRLLKLENKINGSTN